MGHARLAKAWASARAPSVPMDTTEICSRRRDAPPPAPKAVAKYLHPCMVHRPQRQVRGPPYPTGQPLRPPPEIWSCCHWAVRLMRCLSKIKRHVGSAQHYDFVPEGFMLPQDYEAFHWQARVRRELPDDASAPGSRGLRSGRCLACVRG